MKIPVVTFAPVVTPITPDKLNLCKIYVAVYNGHLFKLSKMGDEYGFLSLRNSECNICLSYGPFKTARQAIEVALATSEVTIFQLDTVKELAEALLSSGE